MSLRADKVGVAIQSRKIFEKTELSIDILPIDSFASLKDKIFKEYKNIFFNDFI